MAVLGFHLKVPGFAGGFVGVDVFFLITGYLMTGIVLRDLEKQCFSFRSFALNRMRRIYPALAVVVIVSAVAGWFLTLPGEYIRHLRQASYALAALSNFAFDADNGYFASAAQTKPLLHTWSLAIEWQFYIWMPLAAALLWKLALLSTDRLKVMLVAFGALSLASFLWCLWQNHSDMMGSAFFSLRARAWEPLAGGMIALLELRRRPESPDASFTAPAMSATGWAILLLCIAYPLPEREWPGALTLLPILGTALIVLARWKIAGGGFSGLTIVQYIGSWSYSIYLWHWPVWVFFVTWLLSRGHEVTNAERAFVVSASIAMGAASYYLVEQPLQRRRDIWPASRLVLSATFVFLSLLAFTGIAFYHQGFPKRLPEYLLAAEEARKTGTPRDECFRNSNSLMRANVDHCVFGVREAAGGPSAILWGDSFATISQSHFIRRR